MTLEEKIKQKTVCPECGGPCNMSWSGLELVENTGDETLATKHYHSLLSELLPVMKEMKEAVEHARNQMNQARHILQETGGGNWGMLDSSKQELALEKFNALFEDKQKQS